MSKLISQLTSLSFSLFFLISCNNSEIPKAATIEQPSVSNLTSDDSLAVVSGVQDFFKAFDERDMQKLHDLMSAEMKIIHHNGATTSREEMITILKETKNWWPRTRKLTEFECISNVDLAIVGVKNEVVFTLPENKTVVEPYRETWMFRKTGNLWKAVRCHYSKITVDKHSEEVE